MPITPLPTPPSTADRANFDERADDFLSALPQFQAEANALEANVNAKEASTTQAVADAMAAGLANAAANAAATAADRVQTGQDRAAAAADAERAETAADGVEAIVGFPVPTGADVGKALKVFAGPTLGYGVAGVSGYQEFNASQAWPRPADAEYFWVEILTPGGSGAATYGSSSWTLAEGGAGGVWRSRLMRAVDLPASISVVIGAPGAAVTANSTSQNVNGNQGGTCSFGSFSVPGGRGGRANIATSGPPNAPLNWASTAANAFLSFGTDSWATGGRGDVGGDSVNGGGGGGGAATGSASYSGGASANAGQGGTGRRSTASGANISGDAGTSPAGGGGAAAVYGSTAVATSGAGAAGRVRVWWW